MPNIYSLIFHFFKFTQIGILKKGRTYVVFYVEINFLSCCVFYTVCNCMHKMFNVHEYRQVQGSHSILKIKKISVSKR